MARKSYNTISIPDTLMKEIDLIIAKKNHGYTSRAELVKDAIRRLLKELKS